MTTKYICNRCGKRMDFVDEKIVALRVGAGEITKGDFESNKQADICLDCWPIIDAFINGQDAPRPKLSEFDQKEVIDFLKAQGWLVYWRKSRPKK